MKEYYILLLEKQYFLCSSLSAVIQNHVCGTNLQLNIIHISLLKISRQMLRSNSKKNYITKYTSKCVFWMLKIHTTNMVLNHDTQTKTKGEHVNYTLLGIVLILGLLWVLICSSFTSLLFLMLREGSKLWREFCCERIKLCSTYTMQIYGESRKLWRSW